MPLCGATKKVFLHHESFPRVRHIKKMFYTYACTKKCVAGFDFCVALNPIELMNAENAGGAKRRGFSAEQKIGSCESIFFSMPIYLMFYICLPPER